MGVIVDLTFSWRSKDSKRSE